MIRSLKSISKGEHGGDAQRNIQAGMRLIQAKTIGEDLGIIDKQRFSGHLVKVPKGDMVLMKDAQKQLGQKHQLGISHGSESKRASIVLFAYNTLMISKNLLLPHGTLFITSKIHYDHQRYI